MQLAHQQVSAEIDLPDRVVEKLAMAEAYRLHASLMYQLTLTSRLQERRLEDGLRRLGLTRASWCVLLAVHVEGQVQPSEIAQFIGIDRTATSRTLRQMEAKGWLNRRSGTNDRRTTEVALTDAGVEILNRAAPVARENLAHFLAKLADGEAGQLQDILARLRQGEPRDISHF